jgi:hypothetical protein
MSSFWWKWQCCFSGLWCHVDSQTDMLVSNYKPTWYHNPDEHLQDKCIILWPIILQWTESYNIWIYFLIRKWSLTILGPETYILQWNSKKQHSHLKRRIKKYGYLIMLLPYTWHKLFVLLCNVYNLKHCCLSTLVHYWNVTVLVYVTLLTNFLPGGISTNISWKLEQCLLKS